MSRYSNKIVVSYPGGAYGLYLLWLVYTLTTEEKIVPPFKSKGNSHNAIKIINNTQQRYMNLHTDDLNNIDQIDIADTCYLIKNHPKIKQEDQTDESIDKLLNLFGKIILLYPAKSDYLLNIHN